MVGNQAATELDCAKTTRQGRDIASGVTTASSATLDRRQEAKGNVEEDAVGEVSDRTGQDEVGEAKECHTAKSQPWS